MTDTLIIRPAHTKDDPRCNEDDFLVLRLTRALNGSIPNLPGRGAIISAADAGHLEKLGVTIVEMPAAGA